MPLVEHPTNALSYEVIGAAIEVHRVLGPGLLEGSYRCCLCRELEIRNVPHEGEVPVPLRYKGILPKAYVIDSWFETP